MPRLIFINVFITFDYTMLDSAKFIMTMHIVKIVSKCETLTCSTQTILKCFDQNACFNVCRSGLISPRTMADYRQ